VIRRILPLLVGLLGLTGCPDEPCFPLPPSVPTTQPGVIMAGEPVRLTVSPQSLPSCTGRASEDSPSSFSAEIYGPDNQPVPHQASLDAPNRTTGVVRFTPEQVGRYHVFTAFEPVGGIQQFSLHAAIDRSAEAALHPLSQSCASLERTRRGAWVCDTDVLRDDALVRRFSGGRLAVAGDVVWVLSNGAIQRFVDTGTDLTLTASTPQRGSPEFLLAFEDELLLLSTSALERVGFDGAALAYTGSAPWVPGTSPFSPPGPVGLLLRAGDRVGVVTRRIASTQGLVNELCTYRLEDGRILGTHEACRTFTPAVLGYEPDILWTGEATPFTNIIHDVRRMEWTGTELVEQASFPLGPDLELAPRSFPHRQTVVPVILAHRASSSSRPRPVVPVYSPERRAFILEHLDAEIPTPLASTTLLWGMPLGGPPSASIRVRVRPPP
jgi:hypothetical protein